MTTTACRMSMPGWSGGSWSERLLPVEAAAGAPGPGLTPLPEAALKGFPSVEEIVANGVVRRG